MVAVLFMVGKHLESPDIVATLLDTARVPAKPIYEMASEIPLVLYDCGFEDLHWNRQSKDGEGASEEGLRKLVTHFEAVSQELYLKSKVAGLMLAGVMGNCPSLPKDSYLSILLNNLLTMNFDHYYRACPLVRARNGRQPRIAT